MTSLPTKRRKVVLYLDRNDLVLLMNGLEEMIDAYQDQFGMGDEKRLLDLLLDRLHRHDGSHEYRKAVSRV